MNRMYARGFMLPLFVIHICSASANKCPDTLCKCEHGDVSCRRHGHNLTYIPKLDYVRNLYFTDNYLQNVSQHTFANISTPELKSLSLANDGIQTIAGDTFEHFTRLDYLNLGYNNIYVRAFEAVFLSLSTLDDLNKFSMNALSLPNMPDDFFKNISGTQLVVLTLRDNNITRVPSSVFTSFEYLEVLDLKYNAIESYDTKEAMKTLRVLNIAQNKFVTFPTFCSSDGNSLVPALMSLYIDYNSLTVMNKSTFRCLKTLHKLDVSANHFKILDNDLLYHIVHLKVLLIKWNTCVSLRIEPFAFRSQSLTRLYFHNYIIAKYSFVSIADTFNNTPNLRALYLQSVSFVEFDMADLETLFMSLAKLQVLKLYNVRISTISRKLFNRLPNLRYLNLARNTITTLKNKPFKNLILLKSLILGHNLISEVDYGMLPIDVSRFKHLDMRNNPFTCSCQIIWFKSWLANTHTHIKGYPEQYMCAEPKVEKGKLLKDVTFTYRECHPFTTYESAAMIGCPVVLVIATVAIVLYRNRWNIKHYIYLVRKRRHYERIENEDFVYDAFVSYSQLDYEWVTGTMLPKLELEENCKLCVHDRDFAPGKYILDNIVTNLDISRKIVLVVSNEFAKSDWCRFEMKLAQKRSIEDETDTVIVVMLEDLEARNVPKSMKVLLNTTTYIEWTVDLVGQQLFWTKLTAALRRPA